MARSVPHIRRNLMSRMPQLDKALLKDLATLAGLPPELLKTVFDLLSPSEAALMGRGSIRLESFSLDYFKKFNSQLIKDGFYEQIDFEKLYLNNSKEIFAKILEKILERMQARKNVKLYENHAYLILLIKYCSVDKVEDFVKESFNRKVVNISIKTNESQLTPFHVAIETDSVEKLDILFKYANTDATKIYSLIKFSIDKGVYWCMAFLWDHLYDTKKITYRLAHKKDQDLDKYKIEKERQQYQKEFINLAKNYGQFKIVEFFLKTVNNLSTLFSKTEILSILNAAFAAKNFSIINFLISEIPSISEDGHSIMYVAGEAISAGNVDLSLEYINKFFNLINLNQYADEAEKLKEKYPAVISTFVNIAIEDNANEKIIKTLLTYIKYASSDTRAKILEFILKKNYLDCRDNFLQFHFLSAGMVLCIALKQKQYDIAKIYNHPREVAGAAYEGKLLLIYAIEAGLLNLVEELLEYYVAPNSPQPQNNPLLVAITQPNLQILNILLKKLSVTEEHLISAIKNKKLDVLEILLNKLTLLKNAIDYDKLLYKAVQSGHLPTVDFLVKKGANPDAVVEEVYESDESDEAEDVNNTEMLIGIAAREEYWPILKRLLEHSKVLIDSTARESLKGFSKEDSCEFVNNVLNEVLVAATKASQDEIVLSILPHISNTNDEDRNTLLHKVAKGNCINSIMYLMKQGHVQVVNNKNLLPANIAALNGNIRVFQFLLSHGLNINKSPKSSFLSNAVLNRHEKLVEYMLEKGANPDIPLISCINDRLLPFRNCYEWAAAVKNKNILNMFIENQKTLPYFLNDPSQDIHILLLYYIQIGDCVNFIKCLEHNNFDVNSTIPNGTTFLLKAIKFDRLDIVEYLADCGANVQNNGSVKPLLYAAQLGQWTITRHLLFYSNAIDGFIPEDVHRLYYLAQPNERSSDQLLYITNSDFRNPQQFIAVSDVQARLEKLCIPPGSDVGSDLDTNSKKNSNSSYSDIYDSIGSSNIDAMSSSSDSSSSSSDENESELDNEPVSKKRATNDEEIKLPSAKKPKIMSIESILAPSEEEKDQSPKDDSQSFANKF